MMLGSCVAGATRRPCPNLRGGRLVTWCAVLVTLACHRQTYPRARVPELSGLVASRAHPGVFWAHGDSGNDPVLFAIDEGGRTLAQVEVQGASFRDWEDIALDSRGNLYVGDIGNNDSDRDDLAIHVVPEPDPTRGGQKVRPARTIRFRYPDQRDPKGGRAEEANFDAEALFVLQDRLYLATKHRADTRTTLYRVPLSAGAGQVVLQKLHEYPIKARRKQKGGMVTAGDASPDGSRVALLTYREVLIFRVAGSGVLEGPIAAAPTPKLDELEALAWDQKGILLGAESGQLARVPVPTQPFRLIE
jgi:hypothetical protein